MVVGDKGVGGMVWRADAALDLDVWITALPAGTAAGAAAPIYEQYADATGHAPPLRENASECSDHRPFSTVKGRWAG